MSDLELSDFIIINYSFLSAYSALKLFAGFAIAAFTV